MLPVPISFPRNLLRRNHPSKQLRVKKLYKMTENSARDKYIRVTKVLSPFSGLDKIDPEIVAKAGRRGTKVHKICEGIMHDLGELGVDEETKGYVESFKKWWALGHHVVMIEHRFFCDRMKITGQVDLIIKKDDELVIIDLKTSSKPSKTWPAQGSAYAYLARQSKHDIRKIQFLHLSKHGAFPKIYEYPVDDSFFLDIFRTWEHFFKEE